MATPVQDDMQQQKFSRYRSTRQKAAAQSTATSAHPPTSYTAPTTESDTIQRSRSRYRKARPNGTDYVPRPVPSTSDPSTQVSNPSARPSQTRGTGTQRERPAPSPPAHASSARPSPNGSLPVRSKTSREDLRGESLSADGQARLQARKLLEKEAERQRKMKEKMAAQHRQESRQRRQEQHEEDKQAQNRATEEADRRERQAMESRRQKDAEAYRREAEESVARQRQNLGRPRHQLDTEDASADGASKQDSSRKAESPHTPQSPSVGVKPSGSREFFGIFKRKREAPTPDTAPLSGYQQPAKPQPSSAPLQDAPAAADAVRGMDAPISAVNAGDRQVLVEAGGKTIPLSVTPTTTPVDLIRAAATFLGESVVNPKTSVLMEKFGKVGVQRPLRKYEHVRDVMNSWDDDRQNTLVLVPSATDGRDPELEAYSIPSSQPEEFGCQLSYSQRPGKWDRRWITLRQDGQMTIAKKSGMKATDQTNVCHLSDFDIYVPAPKQLTRKIKPPKKHCFAIKSQQKSNLFMSMESFVHFFCTSDKRVAAEFYREVQGWRSWYLVNVMAQGQKKSKDSADLSSTQQQQQRQTAAGSQGTGQHARVASGESGYQIGSFKPLIDLDSFKSSNNTTDATGALARTRTRSVSAGKTQGQGFSFSTQRNRTSSGRAGAAPPSAFPSTLNANVSSASNDNASPSDAAFAPTGLLGRTYSKRQAEAQARENNSHTQTSTFTAPTFINPPPSVAVNPTHQPSAASPPRKSIDHASSDPTLKRTVGPAKPLVDLTPAYQAPPQFSKRGKGFHPDSVGAGGLVASATTPEIEGGGVRLPETVDLGVQRGSRRDPPGGARGAGGIEGPGKSVEKHFENREAEKRQQQFEKGSLLYQVQRSGKEHFDEGVPGRRWDRSRGWEVEVAKGEGV